MFCDEEYIDEKVHVLRNMIENNDFKKNQCNNFIEFDDLEDEYSHNEIEEAQQIFMNKAKEYLASNYSGHYAMWCDWCVHISTVELYREIMWKNTTCREEYKKIREKRDVII